MVQVDVFWTYGLGASFAVAGHRQLRNLMREPEGNPYHSKFFVGLLLFLLLLFVPSSVYMLWAFPSWHTMHVGIDDIHPWMATALVTITVLCAMLGFWVATALIRGGRLYAAFLQWVAGYFLMFFMVAYGWDGTGYQRYFSITRADFLNWSWDNARAWSASDVAVAVNVFTVLMVPLLFYLLSSWFKEGYAYSHRDGARSTQSHPSRLSIAFWIALLIVGVALGAAIAISVLMQYVGVVLGLVIAGGMISALSVRQWGLLHVLYRRLSIAPGA